MNLTLHWLRRDLRRHALLILLWALLVALFTWARVWLRTHPERIIGDRDLWLSLPAAGLGFAEVCLLLRLLLDDPARGAQVFWKTRPPSGGAVFAAKAMIIAVVALVIPLTAEGVFLQAVGISSGGAERIMLYLLLPVLALITGAAAANWQFSLLWLPPGVFIPYGCFILCIVVLSTQVTVYADYRLSAAVALLAAGLMTAWVYARRSSGLRACIALLLVPGLAAGSVALTGWLAAPELKNPPPGRDATNFRVTWERPPYAIGRVRSSNFDLVFPLRIEGFTPGDPVEPSIASITVSQHGRKVFTRAPSGSSYESGAMDGSSKISWQVPINDTDELARLSIGGYTISGTIHLRCYDRQRHSLPLKGTHTITAGRSRWRVMPAAVPFNCLHHLALGSHYGHILHQWEHVTDSNVRSLRDSLDGNTAALRRITDGLTIPAVGFDESTVSSLLAGTAYGSTGPTYNIPGETPGGTAIHDPEAVRAEFTDPAQQENWRLEFDTLSFSGTLEVPFSLSFSLPPPQP